MKYLQQRREELGHSQQHVALEAQMSRTHYQRVEQGLVAASPQQAQALERILGLPVFSTDHLFGQNERRDLSASSLFEVENLSRATWAHAARLSGSHGLSPAVWSQLSHFFHTDSALECNALAQLAAFGAGLRLDSPLLWGFKGSIPVDRHDQFLGALRLPCLFYRKEKVVFVFWPQFRLRPGEVTWRVDGLVFYRDAKRRVWLVVEFDGTGHDARLDLYRASQLRLPEVRITGKEIGARKTAELLLQRASLARIPDFSALSAR